MRITGLLFFCFWISTGLFAGERFINRQVQEQIIHDLDTFKKSHRLTSLSFALFQGNNEYFDYASGYANVAQRIPATPEHLYTLASVTKTLTGALTVELARQGKLALQDPVFRYVKGFPKNVTILDLLNHTSGFLREKESEKYIGNSSYREVVKYLPVQFKLKIHRYANFNYGALGAVIEQATGRPYADVIGDFYQNITGEKLYFSNHKNEHRSRLFVKNYVLKHRRWVLHKPVEFGLWEPAAFAQTSASALARFVRHQMTPQFIDLLKRHAVVVKKRYLSPDLQIKECYSLGYRLRYVNGELHYIYHNGFLYGVLSTLYYFPKKDVGFVALSNMSSYPRQTLSLGGLYRKVEQVIDFDFNKKIADFTAENGYLEGAVFYETMKREGELLERYMEAFAQDYLDENNVEAAVNILKLNAYAFPESAKTYQTLAEVYLQNGYNELAIENLKKSLQLEPDGTTSRRLYNKLVSGSP